MEQSTQESILRFRTKQKKTWKYYLGEIIYGLLKILVLYLVLFLIQNCVGGMAVVHGKSMEPTFIEGDRVIFQRIGYEPERGDIVICRTGKGYENELIKRVIGLPGDVIYINEETGVVTVNGEELEEPYLGSRGNPEGDIDYPLKVPNGQYFVMGDNRSVSLDSRCSEIGMLERERIDGKVIFRIFPFSKIGKTK